MQRCEEPQFGHAWLILLIWGLITEKLCVCTFILQGPGTMCLLYSRPRRGFAIRLKTFEPRVPDFGGPQNFGSKDNFQHFCKHYICIFVLVQRNVFLL